MGRICTCTCLHAGSVRVYSMLPTGPVRPSSGTREPGTGGPLPAWSSARHALASCADTSRPCAPWTGVWSDLAGSGVVLVRTGDRWTWHCGGLVVATSVHHGHPLHACLNPILTPLPSARARLTAWTTPTRRFRCRGAPSLGAAAAGRQAR